MLIIGIDVAKNNYEGTIINEMGDVKEYNLSFTCMLVDFTIRSVVDYMHYVDW